MENFNTEANTSNQSTEAVNTTEKYPNLVELVVLLDKAMQSLNACVRPDVDAQDKRYSFDQVLFMLESYKDEILANQAYSLSGSPDMSVEVNTYCDDLRIEGTIEGEVDLSNLYSSDFEIEVELGDIDSPEESLYNSLGMWEAREVLNKKARLQAIADMTKEDEDVKIEGEVKTDEA